MSGVDETLAQIEEKLFSLSQGRVQQLAQLLELAMQSAETRGMAQNSLEMIRPRLKLDRPLRRPNLTRVLAEPFASLLISDTNCDIRRGRIRRSALAPCGAILEARLDPDLRTRLLTRIAALPMERMTRELLAQEMQSMGQELWPAAAAVLVPVARQAESDPSARAALAGALGSDDLVDDLVAIAYYVELAENLRRLDQKLRPVPIAQLTDEHVLSIRAEIRAASKAKAKPGYVVYFVMSRLEQPAMAIAAFEDMDQYPSGLAMANLADVARSAVLADFDDQLRTLRQRASGAVSDRDVAQMALTLLEKARVVANEAGLRDDPDFTKSYRETKTRLSSMVKETVIANAASTILNGAIGEAGEPSKEAMAKAEERARALIKCAQAGAELGIDGEIAREIKGVSETLEQRADNLVREIANKNRTDDEREEARLGFHCAIRLLEIVAGSAKAGRLFQQAQAAQRK